MNLKALARYCYATLPGAAAVRFGLTDLAERYSVKGEFKGLRLIPPVGDGLIVDIGANRGQSIAALRRYAPKSHIVAFEPYPRLARRLSYRYRDDDTITIHTCALGDKSEIIKLYLPIYGRWICDGMAATDRQIATEWASDPNRMFRYDERKLKVEEYSILCKTLRFIQSSPSCH